MRAAKPATSSSSISYPAATVWTGPNVPLTIGGAMTDGGYTINTGDAAALQQRIDREYALWADVIQSANIQAN